jgi:hypothetical protein
MKRRNRLAESLLKTAMDMREGGILDDVACKTITMRHRVTLAQAARGEALKMTREEAKQKLILAGRVLVAEGQDDFTRGHVSVRVPDQPGLFFMKPHSVGLDEIALENILTIDLEGEVVAGGSRRHSEVFIHSEIFKARGDVACVIHTHPPYAVALSASGRPMKCYSQPAALFCGELGVYSDTVNLIRTKETGAGVARARPPPRRAAQEPRGRRGGRIDRGGGHQRDHAGEGRDDPDDHRGRRRSRPGISARGHREAQGGYLEAGPVHRQLRLSGSPVEAKRLRTQV